MNRSFEHSSEPSNEFLDRLQEAISVCVLSGAGISVESGLATFRDPGGIWDKYRPEDLANESAFRHNPTLVQGWYDARRKQALAASPNAGHVALVELEKRFDTFLLVTQNVDTLHARAGTQEQVEVHGNIAEERCIECSESGLLVQSDETGLRVCSDCGGLMRPCVVWFGEQLPTTAFSRATEAAATCDVFLSVGTSSVVYPAAGLPLLASQNGAFVVEVNVEPSALSHAMDEVLVGPAGSILPCIVDRLDARLHDRTRTEHGSLTAPI